MNAWDKAHMLWRVIGPSRAPKVFSFHDCLPDVFSGYIDLLLSKRYRFLGGQDLLERFGAPSRRRVASPGKRREAVLTFDDGRRNCWTVIFPLLKKYGIRAMFFVIPSRVADTDEYYPNLEDYWKGRVSWENLFSSHRRQPYLTWKELEVMRNSGLVDICSHSLEHRVVSVSSRVIDFQHPGVYEMPVHFDEWYQAGRPALDAQWGAPVYERTWAPFAGNEFDPDRRGDAVLNAFVKKNGGYLFFKKKNWRPRLFDFLKGQRGGGAAGHFKKLAHREDLDQSVTGSRAVLEQRLKAACLFFSVPLHLTHEKIFFSLQAAGYKAAFGGLRPGGAGRFGLPAPSSGSLPVLCRIPGFWIKFLAYV